MAAPDQGLTLSVRIAVLPHGQDLELPHYATPGSAGMDLRCAEDASVQLAPLERRALRTGIQIELPPGFEAQVRPRSGLALKQGIGMVNAPGTIDSDYRGEIHVLLINLGGEPVLIERGQRIAQLVVAPYTRVQWQSVRDLEQTERGQGGFGHTGKV